MKLQSTITTELSHQQEHPQMLVIRSQTYPYSMRPLPSQIWQGTSQPNTKTWLCCMTEQIIKGKSNRSLKAKVIDH